MKSKVNELISFILVILTLIIMIVFSFIITYSNRYLDLYSYFIIGIGLLALLNSIFNKTIKFEFNKYEILILIMMIFTILSLPSSINIKIALFGAPSRNEGLFVILSYYLLFLNSLNIKNNKYIKIIIYSILSIGLINIIYGIFQTDLIKTNLNIVNKWYYAKGLLGNSMYFGTLMCICTSLILGIFIKSNSIKIVNLILLVFFIFGSFLSGSMATFVSLILVLIFVLYDLIKTKKDRKKQIIRFIICILIGILFLFLESYRNSNLNNDVNELLNEASSALKGNVSDNFGTGRIYIWKNTISKIKENLLFGVGIDNFKYAFSPYLIDNVSGLVVDKAHNDYLQKILCEGILSGIMFIVLLLTIFFSNINKIKNKYKYGLFLSFICYSIQAFFSISVTRVALIYFILMGILASEENNEN